MIKRIVVSLLLTGLCLGPVEGAETCIGVEREFDIGESYQICWDMGPENDLASYIIYMDGEVYETISVGDACGEGPYCESPRYESNEAGNFSISIRAADGAGNTSPMSEPVQLRVVDLPPSKPGGCSIRLP